MVSSLAGSVTCSKLLLRHVFQRQGAMHDSLACIAEALHTNKTTHMANSHCVEVSLLGNCECSRAIPFADDTGQSILQGGSLYRAAM